MKSAKNTKNLSLSSVLSLIISGTAIFSMATITTLVLLTASPASAHEHSVTVCSTAQKDVCAHLGFEKVLNSTEEGKFMAHVMTPGNLEVASFKLDLWMDMGNGHGHGSSPVDIKDTGKNRFEISNAWFVMPGQWLVRLDFDFNQNHHHIEIPVIINEPALY